MQYVQSTQMYMNKERTHNMQLVIFIFIDTIMYL